MGDTEGCRKVNNDTDDDPSMMAEQEADSHTELKVGLFLPIGPVARVRSHSDASGFRSRVLFKLRGARSGRSVVAF